MIYPFSKYKEDVWGCYTRYLCLVPAALGLGPSSAVPVEQDFDGITFVKIDTQSFIFGSAPDQANYQAPEHPKVVPLGIVFGWVNTRSLKRRVPDGSNPSTLFPTGL